jgi:hypothetical protein
VKCLSQVLDQPIGQRLQLEQTYISVVSQVLVGVEDVNEKNKLCCDFHDIIGSIILLANPLSTMSLAKLLHIEMIDIDDQLRCLQSVLSIPSDSNTLVYLFHLSFREFLLMKTHADLGQQFAIDECISYEYLADKCLILLQSSGGLYKDIYQLGCLGVLREEIEETTITEHIPPHLQYACHY